MPGQDFGLIWFMEEEAGDQDLLVEMAALKEDVVDGPVLVRSERVERVLRLGDWATREQARARVDREERQRC